MANHRQISFFGKKIPLLDLAVLAAFIALFGWFYYVIRFGVNAADEGLYYNIAQRVLQGDRLLVDEWQVSQFSSFLLLLPVKAYTAAVGSAEGMILFMRALYVTETGILYWWLYSRYRRYGYSGLAGVALFCAFVPGDMFAVFYLTMALQGLMVLCTLLFLPSEKPRSPLVLVFSGVVFACTVLAQPPFCLIYFVYCGIVLFRKIFRRKYGEPRFYLLRPRVWGWITAGIALTAIPVVTYFLIKSTLPEILRLLPELFTDSEYDFRSEHVYNLLWKSLILGDTFGYGNAVLWALLAFSAAALPLLRKKEKKAEALTRGGKRKNAPEKTPRFHSEQLRRLIFIATCVCFAASYVAGIFSFVKYKADVESHQLYMYYFYHSAPVAAFCAVCGLLHERRSVNAAAGWCFIVAADFLISYGSECACRLAGVVLFPMMFISARTLIAELKAAGEACGGKRFLLGKKSFRIVAGTVSAAALCAMLCFESVGGYISRFYLPMEHYESGAVDAPLDTALRRGPLKGIVTNGAIADAYEATLADLDRLGAEGPVYIMGTCPYLYLHLQSEWKMGTYSSWYVDDDAFARQLRYMQLLPEKRPAVVYVPFVDFVTYRVPTATEAEGRQPVYEQKLAWVREYSDCVVTKGAVGYIVKIENWKLPPLQAP